MNFGSILQSIQKFINPSVANGGVISPLAKSTPTPTPYQGKSGPVDHPVFNGLLGTHATTPTPTTFKQVLGIMAPGPKNNDVLALIPQFFPNDPKVATAVARQESTLNPAARNSIPNRGIDAIGLFQINLPAHQAQVPGNTYEEKAQWLMDPSNNAKFAADMQSKQGWGPWEAYTSGAYQKYLQ